MRCVVNSVVILLAASLASAQVPSNDWSRLNPAPACAQDTLLDALLTGVSLQREPVVTLAANPARHGQQIREVVKEEINQAMMSENRPAVEQWRPMTTPERFQTFLRSLYAPGTYAGAGMDAVAEKFLFGDPRYQHGWAGLGQHYAAMVINSESDIFFKSFLLPAVLKQDPRYYRNPILPFSKRFFYSTSRVFITRADSGGRMFNGSMLLGSAARQSLKDLYVPGERQGIGAIGSRVAFDLLREAGSNLMHEFWPDVRRRFFRR